MPRAFLVVKEKHGESSSCGEKRRRIKSSSDEMESDCRPSPTSSPMSNVSCLGSDTNDARRSPVDSNFAHAGGSPFNDVSGAFDLSHKRAYMPPLPSVKFEDGRRSFFHGFPSPGSAPSDTSSESSLSPTLTASGFDNQHSKVHKEMLKKHSGYPPIFSHRQAQVMEPPRDVPLPMSPLHHIINRSASNLDKEHPLFPATSMPFPLGMGFPFNQLAAPFLVPPHCGFYPGGPFLPPKKAEPKQEPQEKISMTTEKSTKQKTSHNIDDILARSPPKTREPFNTSATPPQRVVRPDIGNRDSLQPGNPMYTIGSFNSNGNSSSSGEEMSPTKNMAISMEQHLSAHSPLTAVPRIPVAPTQSPKTASFAPSEMAGRHLDSRFFNASVQRKLEMAPPSHLSQDLRKTDHYVHADFDRFSFKEQEARNLEHKKRSRLRESKAFIPNITSNKCLQSENNYMAEYSREIVFPQRTELGLDVNSGESRLSPKGMDNLPMDFSKPVINKSGPPRFHCDGCKKSYSTLNGLSKHKEFHCVSHIKKEFSCKHCAKTYTSLGALKMHIRTHTLPCKCAICGKAFSRPWLLQGHVRTHTGEKPFSCPHCSRAFADRSNLRAHLQTHTDIKRYSCDNCSKTFSRMSLLTKHRENGCVRAVNHV